MCMYVCLYMYVYVRGLYMHVYVCMCVCMCMVCLYIVAYTMLHRCEHDAEVKCYDLTESFQSCTVCILVL